jgi:hypothetical protein
VGQGSVVGIAIRYGLAVQGSNPVGGEIFHLSITALEPTQPVVKLVPGFLPESNTAGVWS